MRYVYCIKEGGLFVCCYGKNGVCFFLFVEGVSDKDYEVYVKKSYMKLEDGKYLFCIFNFVYSILGVL